MALNLSLDDQALDIIDANMDDWMNSIVIPEVKRMASAMRLPLKFIESISFRKTGKNTGQIVNTFGSRDVPLAKWFNYGTKRDYLIEPKVKHPPGALRAPRDKERVNAKGEDIKVVHPSVLKWKSSKGDNVFAKSVIHPGFPKTLAMQFGVEQGKKRLIEQLPALIGDQIG